MFGCLLRPNLVGADVREERRGSSVNLTNVVAEGDASVSLSKVKVLDEGSYICSVSLGPFRAQQIIQLHLLRKYSWIWEMHPDASLMLFLAVVAEAPQVSLSEEKLVFKEESQALSCHSSKYYPLDVQVSEGHLRVDLAGVAYRPCSSLQMEWLLLFPSDTEPTVPKDQGSLSSHRQHADGSYSLSSHFAVPSTAPPGATIICRVSHQALDVPLSISLLVESPQASMFTDLCCFSSFSVKIPYSYLISGRL